ncbi:MAG: substrate-binding periplasmic protein [Rhodoferax sp.]
MFSSCISLGSAASADTWVIRSDAWCPYNCAPEDSNPGYMVEILQGAALANGHQLDYKLLPYSRALQQAREGKITGIVGMLAYDRKGFVFSNTMGVDSNCLIVNKGSGLRYRSKADLDNMSHIGVIEGYGYPQDFVRWRDRNPEKVEALSGENALTRQVQKLKAQRLGAFIENENVFRYAASTSPEMQQVEVAGCMTGRDTLHIGISTKNPKAKEIKAQVDAYLASIRKNGELRRLLAKYQVAPWD